MNEIKTRFKNTANETLGREGMLIDLDYESVVSGVKNSTYLLWEKQQGTSWKDSLREEMLAVGDKFLEYLTYYNDEHLTHCPPTDVVTGISDLPISHVYTNGVRTSTVVDRRLDTGETLSGVDTYRTILKFFVPGQENITEIQQVGIQLREEIYADLLENAKNYTGAATDDEAKNTLKSQLYDQSQFFNDAPFPESEWSNNTEAVKNCDTLEKAKTFCPNRYEAIMKWFDFARDVTAKASPLTVPYFYYTGPRRSTPNCPVDMAADFNPFTAAQSYMQSDAQCSEPANYNIPFWTDNLGPKWQEYDTNVHEAIPGHHLQVQGGVENFVDPGCTMYTANLSNEMYFTDYTEGWALYSESPISVDMNIYEGEPLQAHGRYAGLLWRACRLVLDTGFGAFGMKFDEGLAMFEDYLWDTTDLPGKELDRYANNPGQALGYMWGRQFILKMRKHLSERIGETNWNIKDFHYQYLSLVGTPLSYIEVHLNIWADCVMDTGNSVQYASGNEKIYLT